MQKPELLCTAANLDEIVRLIDAGVDGINIGHEKFGLRVAGNFSLEEIEKAIQICHEHHVNVYVSVNALFHNDQLAELESYLGVLATLKPDAIIFGEPTVYMLARKVAPNIPLHWNPEMLCTNVETINYWGRKGAKRAYLARELNMDSILEIKEEAEIEIQVQVFGPTCIFQSRRDLVSSYQRYLEGEKARIEKGKISYIKEEKRPNLFYPIYEDENGTNILSAEDLCILEHIDELMDGGIDSFKIEGLLRTTEELVEIVSVFREAIDLYCQSPEHFRSQVDEWMNRLRKIQPPSRPLTTGFYFKEQVY